MKLRKAGDERGKIQEAQGVARGEDKLAAICCINHQYHGAQKELIIRSEQDTSEKPTMMKQDGIILCWSNMDTVGRKLEAQLHSIARAQSKVRCQIDR